MSVFGKQERPATSRSFGVLKCNAMNNLSNEQEHLLSAREYCCLKRLFQRTTAVSTGQWPFDQLRRFHAEILVLGISLALCRLTENETLLNVRVTNHLAMVNTLLT